MLVITSFTTSRSTGISRNTSTICGQASRQVGSEIAFKQMASNRHQVAHTSRINTATPDYQDGLAHNDALKHTLKRSHIKLK